MPDPKTEELRVETVQRELEERRQADDSTEPTHARRAERAGYLREKLKERAKSEDERD
jgi:hypothetical protein